MSTPAIRPSATQRSVRHADPGPGVGRPARTAVAAGVTTAVVAAFGVWLTWRIFVASAAGQRVDQAVFVGAAYGRTRLWRVAEPILEVISVPYIAFVLALAVVIAIARRRWALALQVALLMAGANLTTQLLKYTLLHRPDLGVGQALANTLPSGHTTAAASVSAALVFVVPPRGRPWAAVLGAAYTAVTGVSTLIGRWHRPSDVVAAVLVVLAWSALACALQARTTRSAAARARTGHRVVDRASTVTAEFARPRGSRPRAWGLGVGGGILLLVAFGAALPAAVALDRTWTFAGPLTSRAQLLVAYAGGAFGVVAFTSLAFAVLLVLRHRAGQAI